MLGPWPLSEARHWTWVFMDTVRICLCWAIMGTSWVLYFEWMYLSEWRESFGKAATWNYLNEKTFCFSSWGRIRPVGRSDRRTPWKKGLPATWATQGESWSPGEDSRLSDMKGSAVKVGWELLSPKAPVQQGWGQRKRLRVLRMQKETP